MGKDGWWPCSSTKERRVIHKESFPKQYAFQSALYSLGLPTSCSRLERDYWEEIINLKISLLLLNVQSQISVAFETDKMRQ